MIKVTIAVQDGVHTRGEILEFEGDVGAEELARVEELAHEMIAHLERVVRLRKAQAKGRAG